MSKTLLYRLFKLGAIPKDAKEQIQREGVVLQDEGIGGSITLKRFRAPGRYHGWRRSWFCGSIVLTRQHFLAFAYGKPIIGLPLNTRQFKELQVSLENEETLCVQFDASTFQEKASGEVAVRFSTPFSQDFLHRIELLQR